MTKPIETDPKVAKSPAEICTTLVLGWLVPGLGHLLQRDTKRGIIIFAVIQTTFVLGLICHGAVLLPPYNPADWGMNAMNILTFVVQLANGLAAMLTMAVSQLFPAWAASTRAHTLFELGSVYLLMAGAVNSIVLGGLYDRHLRRPRPSEEAK